MVGFRIAEVAATTFADADFLNCQSGSRAGNRTIPRGMASPATSRAATHRLLITEEQVAHAKDGRRAHSKNQEFAERIDDDVLRLWAVAAAFAEPKSPLEHAASSSRTDLERTDMAFGHLGSSSLRTANLHYNVGATSQP